MNFLVCKLLCIFSLRNILVRRITESNSINIFKVFDIRNQVALKKRSLGFGSTDLLEHCFISNILE